MLRLAGRHADIVGINPTMHEGKITPQTAADLVPERVQEKIGWVREGAQRAGRAFEEIELNSLVFVVAIAEDVQGLRTADREEHGDDRVPGRGVPHLPHRLPGGDPREAREAARADGHQLHRDPGR